MMKTLRPGMFLSFLFEKEEERKDFIIAFIKQGSERNEKTIFLVESITEENLIPNVPPLCFRENSVKVGVYPNIGTGETTVNVDKIVTFIIDQTHRASDEGYEGLRVCIEINEEMGKLFFSGASLLADGTFKKLLSEEKCLVVFQCHVEKISPDVFLGILGQSPSIIIGGEHFSNIFYHDHGKDGQDINNSSRLKRLADILRERRVLEDTLKRGDAALKASEENYRSIFETAANLIASVDKKGIIIDCNEQIHTVLGYQREEVIGSPFSKLIHPRYLTGVYETVREVIKKGHSYHKEMIMLHRDGFDVYVSVNSAPLKNRMGKISRVISVVEDVTERKRAEAALLESERRYRQLIEVSPDAVLALVDGLIVFANSAAMKLFSVTHPRDIVGKEPAMLVSPEDRKVFIKAVGAVEGKSDQLSPSEVRIIDTDGSVKYTEWIGTIIPQAGKPTTLLMGRDITSRKLAEIGLHESEERYRIAIEHSNDGVSIVRGDSFLYVNRRFVELFGYDDAHAMMNLTIGDTVHPDDRERVVVINGMRQRGELAPARYAFKGIKKNGDTLSVEVSATPICYKGEMASLIYLRDVTDKRPEKELE